MVLVDYIEIFLQVARLLSPYCSYKSGYKSWKGKDREELSTSGAYPGSFMTQIFRTG